MEPREEVPNIVRRTRKSEAAFSDRRHVGDGCGGTFFFCYGELTELDRTRPIAATTSIDSTNSAGVSASMSSIHTLGPTNEER